jgi:N-dimethylarginine dimethylaminohydrolase
VALNEFGKLAEVALRRPAIAFASDEKIDRQWRELNYHDRPDLAKAAREHADFEALLKSAGAKIIDLGEGSGLTLDSLYVRDALIVTPKGLVKCHMGKPARRKEPAVNAGFIAMDVIGEISPPGKIEGGDLVWLDDETLLAGIGYRTNLAGTEQLQRLLGPGVTVHNFDLPHYQGRSDVFHLMSVLSPVDRDLAVVHLPLMPVRLVEFLEARGMGFVDVPEGEFPSMACNVLALGPRHAVMIEGNELTEKSLRAQGCKVDVIRANEISRKGEGGPTCLTRPLRRG